MRWGPVVASVVSALALVAAAFVGISAFDGDAGEEFGLVRLDGLVGETLLLLGAVFVGVGVAAAMRRAPSGAFIGLGLVVALVSFMSRWSLSSDAASVEEYITGAGSATGLDSRLVSAVDFPVTRVDVDPSLTVLAMAGAAALVGVGWSAWVEFDERRQAGARTAGGPSELAEPGGPTEHGPLTEPSQDPHN
jgi:uncharacterized membrane protein AbrB (regulator of aidB expression)